METAIARFDDREARTIFQLLEMKTHLDEVKESKTHIQEAYTNLMTVDVPIMIRHVRAAEERTTRKSRSPH